MITAPTRIKADGQCSLILEHLRRKRGEWVEMPELVTVSGSYNVHTRIDDLRHRRGCDIECQVERMPGSTRHISRYRLVEPEPVPA